jgi:hypothetical protein
VKGGGPIDVEVGKVGWFNKKASGNSLVMIPAPGKAAERAASCSCAHSEQDPINNFVCG